MDRLEKVCLVALIIFVSVEPKEEIAALIVYILIAINGVVFIAIDKK